MLKKMVIMVMVIMVTVASFTGCGQKDDKSDSADAIGYSMIQAYLAENYPDAKDIEYIASYSTCNGDMNCVYTAKFDTRVSTGNKVKIKVTLANTEEVTADDVKDCPIWNLSGTINGKEVCEFVAYNR